jgi:hypothetical protein
MNIEFLLVAIISSQFNFICVTHKFKRLLSIIRKSKFEIQNYEPIQGRNTSGLTGLILKLL